MENNQDERKSDNKSQAFVDQQEFGPDPCVNSSNSEPKKKISRASQWFWSTIIVLALVTLSLAFFSNYRTNNENQPKGIKLEPQKTLENGQGETLKIELEPSVVRRMFNDANEAAIKAARLKASRLLDEAFKPVLSSIAAYTDWHYSIWGSYKELYDGAIGEPAEEVEKRLLGDLRLQIDRMLPVIDTTFDQTFNEYLFTDFEALQSPDIIIGPLSKQIFKDAALQTGGQVLLAGGGALVAKKISALVVKKVATKIAAKAAGKWFAKLGPATAGVVACAWTGPGAAVCGVVAAFLGWFGIDFLFNKLDEAISRDTFAALIQDELMASKMSLLTQIEANIQSKAARQRYFLEKGVQNFTLEQLSKTNKSAICREYKALEARYSNLKQDVSLRTEEEILHLLADAEIMKKTLGLFEASNEIVHNLSNFENNVRIFPISVLSTQLLPDRYATNRSISGEVSINANKFLIYKQKNDKTKTMKLKISNLEKNYFTMNSTSIVSVHVKLEQHLVLRNIILSGRDRLNWNDIISNGNQTEVVLKLSSKGKDSFAAKVRLALRPEKLEALELSPSCKS